MGTEPDIPAVTLRGVGFCYGGPPVLEDVNLSIGQREAVCIVGPNGGGKTTLVKLILGLLTPQRGEIRLFGQPPHRSRFRAGYMPQHAQFDPQFPVSVMDLVLMGRLGEAPEPSDGGSRPRRRTGRRRPPMLVWIPLPDRRLRFGLVWTRLAARAVGPRKRRQGGSSGGWPA